MNCLLARIVVPVLLIAPTFSQERPNSNAEWKVVWRDEFEGNKLDTTKGTLARKPGLHDGISTVTRYRLCACIPT